MKQLLLFYSQGCAFCQLYLRHLHRFYYYSSNGVHARAIDVKSKDPLVKRYTEKIQEEGLPLLVIETRVGNKIISEGVVGMTTETYAEGKLIGLFNSFIGREPNIGDYI